MADQGPMTEANFYILLAMTKPGHGYGLMQRVRELSGGRLVMGPGTLYGVLTRMRREGLIVLAEDDGRRKEYAITEAGRQALRTEYDRLKQMVWDGRILEEVFGGKSEMPKQIILLNGPSSSGKSTLAKALQRRIAETQNARYAIVSIDDLLEMTAEDVIYEDDVFAISPALCEAAAEALQSNDGVIIDHVITSQRIFYQLTARFRSYPLFLVHVTCPPDVLTERENARSNRCPGSAEASYRYLFPQDGYDITVDTHRTSAEVCAMQILKQCRICPSGGVVSP